VGRGSDLKNSLKIKITPWLLGIIGVKETVTGCKTVHLLGNLRIFENENWTAGARRLRGLLDAEVRTGRPSQYSPALELP